jgi:hypothetical protein
MPLFEIHHRHDHHFHPCEGTASVLASIAALAVSIEALKGTIAMNHQETNQALTEVQTALTEAGTEIAEKIQSLEDQLANAGNLSPENAALLNDVRSRAQALANIVPNATGGGEEQPQG